MQITTSKENLMTAINAVQKAINPKSIIPIYSCIKVEASGSKATFTGSSLEMGIESTIPVQVEKEGVTLVPAKYFSDIVRKLPNVSITLSVVEPGEMEIRYDNSCFTLKTMPPNDYTPLPIFNTGLDFFLPAETIKKMIRQTVFAASTDELKAVFTGLLWEINGDELGIVGTDTHRLAWTKGKINTYDKEAKGCFIIPAKTANEIVRLIQDEPCRVQAEKNTVFFSFDNIKINCRVLEGQFPNYRQVIPSQFITTLSVDANQFYSCAERISLFATSHDMTNTINMDIGEDGMISIHSRSEIGFGREEIPMDMSGEALKISFNAKYITDVFKVVDSDKIEIKLSGALSAGIMKIPGDDEFVYLILPVRV